ncbi:MAG: hypothetical protein V3V16_03760 [Melioribacteraceae bacterium]
MKQIKIILILFFTAYFLSGCYARKYVDRKSISPLLKKNASEWSLDECDKIIDHYKSSTLVNGVLNSPPKTDVKIDVLLLNKNTIQALVRKEIIEKRLDSEDYKNNLKIYLEEFTSFTLDTNSLKIITADTNFTSGISFRLYLENITEPYRPIFLEDGYSYFFLENTDAKFSRIIDVTGLYVEDYIQLDGYLNVVVTFSPFASDGSMLFQTNNLDEDYKIIFNGLQKKPIIIEWKTK